MAAFVIDLTGGSTAGSTGPALVSTDCWPITQGPWPDVEPRDQTEADRKLAALAEQREQSIAACLHLSWAHQAETPTPELPAACVRRRTPTQRRTATGARNFRC